MGRPFAANTLISRRLPPPSSRPLWGIQLDEGKWLHIFPEAKVHQAKNKELLRFRWGISRVLMETKNDFEVLPIWLQGERP